MRVRCVKDYNDLQLKRMVKADMELNVGDDRGQVLINAQVAVEVPTPTTEVATKPAPKKATTRKKNVEG